eukprot:TRINITY_DN2025_c0_g1_i6.p1 TRINITY_DN2025_c0_g1~~TRINITY_DN2025_c0_g1_i6.p1  ORF type:complete len:3715 (-),score=578.80 TRINITY_DN2025_c0_g1_i6:350-11494(-)
MSFADPSNAETQSPASSFSTIPASRTMHAPDYIRTLESALQILADPHEQNGSTLGSVHIAGGVLTEANRVKQRIMQVQLHRRSLSALLPRDGQLPSALETFIHPHRSSVQELTYEIERLDQELCDVEDREWVKLGEDQIFLETPSLAELLAETNEKGQNQTQTTDTQHPRRTSLNTYDVPDSSILLAVYNQKIRDLMESRYLNDLKLCFPMASGFAGVMDQRLRLISRTQQAFGRLLKRQPAKDSTFDEESLIKHLKHHNPEDLPPIPFVASVCLRIFLPIIKYINRLEPNVITESLQNTLLCLQEFPKLPLPEVWLQEIRAWIQMLVNPPNASGGHQLWLQSLVSVPNATVALTSIIGIGTGILMSFMTTALSAITPTTQDTAPMVEAIVKLCNQIFIPLLRSISHGNAEICTECLSLLNETVSIHHTSYLKREPNEWISPLREWMVSLLPSSSAQDQSRVQHRPHVLRILTRLAITRSSLHDIMICIRSLLFATGVEDFAISLGSELLLLSEQTREVEQDSQLFRVHLNLASQDSQSSFEHEASKSQDNKPVKFAFDGTHFYCISNGSLEKVTSGFYATPMHSLVLSRSHSSISDNGWVAFVRDRVYVRPTKESSLLCCYSADTLEEEARYEELPNYSFVVAKNSKDLPQRSKVSPVFSDGKYIYTLTLSENLDLVVNTYDPSDSLYHIKTITLKGDNSASRTVCQMCQAHSSAFKCASCEKFSVCFGCYRKHPTSHQHTEQRFEIIGTGCQTPNPLGSLALRYAPVSQNQDLTTPSEYLMSITAMPAYEGASFEELRYTDQALSKQASSTVTADDWLSDCTFFTNGHFMIIKYPESLNMRSSDTFYRVFALNDGNHVRDVLVPNCYINYSPVNIITIPEIILSLPEYGILQVDKPSDRPASSEHGAISLLAHIDRSTRHNLWQSATSFMSSISFQQSPDLRNLSSPTTSSTQPPNYIQLDARTFQLIYSIIDNYKHHFFGTIRATASASPASKRVANSSGNPSSPSINRTSVTPQLTMPIAYVILASLRLLKANIYFLVRAKINPATVGLSINHGAEPQDRSLCSKMLQLLLRIVDGPSMKHRAGPLSLEALCVQQIQWEACEVITFGFSVFYPLESQQLNILTTLLQESATRPCSAKSLLVCSLLDNISTSPNPSRLLIPGQGQNATLLNLLLQRLKIEVSSYESRVDCSGPSFSCWTRKSASLRLLLSIRNDLLRRCGFVKVPEEIDEDATCLLVEYAKQLLDKSCKLIRDGNVTLSSFSSFDKDNVEYSCVIGVLLPSIITSLCDFASQVPIVSKIISALQEFLIVLDECNSSSPVSLKNEEAYLDKELANLTSKNTLCKPLPPAKIRRIDQLPWLLDLQKSTAVLVGKCLQSVISGAPVAPIEVSLKHWLESPLLRGELEISSPKQLPFASELLLATPGSSGARFGQWMLQQSVNRVPLSTLSNQDMERAERAVASVLIHHAGLVGVASSYAQQISSTSFRTGTRAGLKDDLAPPTFLESLWTSAGKVRVWLVQQHQSNPDAISYKDLADKIVTKAEFLLSFSSVRSPVKSQQVAPLLIGNDFDLVAEVTASKLAQGIVQAKTSTKDDDKRSKKTANTKTSKSGRGDAELDNVQSVLEFVFNFVTSPDTDCVDEIRNCLDLQRQRALLRAQGMNRTQAILQKLKMSSSKHDIIRSVVSAFFQGDQQTSYLDNLDGCNISVIQAVRESFGSLFAQFMALFSKEETDVYTKLTILGLFAVNFSAKDHALLHSSGFLDSFKKIFLAPQKSQPSFPSSCLEEIHDGRSVYSLKDTALLSFKMLCHTLFRELDLPQGNDSTQLSDIQISCLELLVTSLHHHASTLAKLIPLSTEISDMMDGWLEKCYWLHNEVSISPESQEMYEESEHDSIELLALVLKLCYCTSLQNYFLQHIIGDLVTYLVVGSHRIQRITLRTLRCLLIGSTGDTFIPSPMEVVVGNGSFKLTQGLTSLVNIVSELAGYFYTRKSQPMGSNEESQKYLASQVLESICRLQTALSSRKNLQTLNSAPIGGDGDSLVSNAAISGQENMVTGVHGDLGVSPENAALLAQSVRSPHTASRNRARTKKGSKGRSGSIKGWDSICASPGRARWRNGYVSRCFAEECVLLLRAMLAYKHTNQIVTEAMTKSLRNIPEKLKKSSESPAVDFKHEVVSLCVLGGHTDAIRIGGTCEVRSDREKTEYGTIVAFDPSTGKARILLASGTQSTYEADKIVPISETPFEPSSFPLTIPILDSYISILKSTLDYKNDLQGHQADVGAVQIKWRGMRSLYHLLENPDSVRLFLASGALKVLADTSLEVADSKLFKHTDFLETRMTKMLEKGFEFCDRLWLDTIPCSPFARLPLQFPTAFDRAHSFYVEVLGEDSRTVFYGGRVSDDKGWARTNRPIPTNIPTYYFEIYIDSRGRSIGGIEFGLVYGEKEVGDFDEEVCVYQDSGRKWRGRSKSGLGDIYGPPYRSGDIVGCGWSPADGVVFFTKNGVNIGQAFRNVTGVCYPYISLGSRGSRIIANFGQCHFRYSLLDKLKASLVGDEDRNIRRVGGMLGSLSPNTKEDASDSQKEDEEQYLRRLQGESEELTDGGLSDLHPEGSGNLMGAIFSSVDFAPGVAVSIATANSGNSMEEVSSDKGERVHVLKGVDHDTQMVLLQNYDPETCMKSTFWLSAHLIRPLSPQQDSFAEIGTLGPIDVVQAIASSGAALSAIHACRSLLSILAKWPDSIEFNLSAFGGYERLFNLLKLASIERAFLPQEGDASPDSARIKSISDVPLQGPAMSQLRAKLANIIQREETGGQKAVVAPYLVDLCVSSGFWLVPSGNSSAQQQHRENAFHWEPSFDLASWILDLICKECPSPDIIARLPDIIDLLLQQLQIQASDNLRMRIVRLLISIIHHTQKMVLPRAPDAKLLMKTRQDMVALYHRGAHASEGLPLPPLWSEEEGLYLKSLVEFVLGAVRNGWLPRELESETTPGGSQLPSTGISREDRPPLPSYRAPSADGNVRPVSSEHSIASLSDMAPDKDDQDGGSSRSWFDIIFEVTHIIECLQERKPLPDTFLCEAWLETREVVVQESPHPYNNYTVENTVQIPDAKSLLVILDCRSSTHPHDRLVFYRDEAEYEDLGHFFGKFEESHFRIFSLDGDTFSYKFEGLHGSDWGFRFSVVPEFSQEHKARLFVSQKDVIEQAMARLPWTIAMDEQLVHYVDSMCEDRGTNPLILTPPDIHIGDTEHMVYPLLQNVPPDALRLRFSILRLFNYILAPILPIVDFNYAVHTGSLSSKICELRGLIFYSTKMELFNKMVKMMPSDTRPTVVINRQQATESPPDQDGDIPWCVFVQIYHQLHDIDPSYLRQDDQAWTVKMEGEGAQDIGGPYRESVTWMCEELQSASLPLFILCPNARLAREEVGIGENRDKFIPRASSSSPIHLSMFEFVGKLMGIAMRTKNPLPLDFPSFVWKPLVGMPLEAKDLRDIDRFCWQYLDSLRNIDKKGVTQEQFSNLIFETFTTSRSDGSVVPLIANGANVDVTFENRSEYCKLVEQARLRECLTQTMAIRKGMATIIPEFLLPLFTWQQLSLRVCGHPDVDLNLLKMHTRYRDNITPSDPIVGYFWNALESFSQSQRRLFLRFASGRERLPSAAEFRQQDEMKFGKLMVENPDMDFPRAQTCFFSIEIPDYSSETILRERLLQAITTCFDIDTDHVVGEEDEEEFYYA